MTEPYEIEIWEKGKRLSSVSLADASDKFLLDEYNSESWGYERCASSDEIKQCGFALESLEAEILRRMKGAARSEYEMTPEETAEFLPDGTWDFSAIVKAISALRQQLAEIDIEK